MLETIDNYVNNSSSIEDLAVSYYEDGIEVIKQLDKKVLSKGAWTTIIFKHQDWDAKAGRYGLIKFTIRRYQKKNGVYKQRSKFNISSVEQAEKIIEILSNWIDK